MRRSKVVTRLAAASFLVAVAACAARTPAVVRVDGSAGVAPLVNALASAYARQSGGDSLAVATGLGATARLNAVAEGRIDVAMASHGVGEDELTRRNLRARRIASAPVVFAVNASVAIDGLSRDQVCAIYAGSTANWRQLGGPDLEIRPRMRPAQEVDAEVALSGIPCLAGAKHGAGVQIVERPDDMASAIASTVGAIGLTSGTLVQQSGGRIRALALDGVAPSSENVAAGRYQLIRQFILVHRREPPPAVARFLEFVASRDGQSVIRGNGAVPIEP